MSTETEWFEEQRFRQRPTVLPLLAWAIIVGLVIAGLFYAGHALAEPRFKAEGEGAVITLYDEPCLIKDQIANLPYRATWEEKGKTYQGCFAPRPDAQLIVAYFEDHTVALIPFQALQKVTGA